MFEVLSLCWFFVHFSVLYLDSVCMYEGKGSCCRKERVMYLIEIVL